MKNIKKDTGMSFDEVYKMIQECWWETKKQDNSVIYTGIEGKLNFYEEVAKQYGEPWTAEDRERHRQDLIDSGQTIFKI